MIVSLVQWGAVIGILNSQSSAISYHVCNLTRNFVSMFAVLLYCWHYFESDSIFLLTLIYILIILQCYGDIESNSGLKKLKPNSFSVCHWNLNSLSAHNFLKLSIVFWCSFGQLFKSQEKNPSPFSFLTIFNNKNAS